MKGLIYGIVYILVVALIFEFFLNKAGAGIGLNVSGRESLFISKDGGKNWSQIEIKDKKLTISGENIIFSTQNPSYLYLASAQGIFQIKEDKTATKEEQSIDSFPVLKFIQNPYDINILYLVVQDGNNQKILISYDKGKSFKTIFVSGENDKINVFKIDPIVYSTFYIGTQKGLFLVSNDAGQTWQKKQDFSNQSVTAIGIKIPNREIFLAIGPPSFELSYLVKPPLEPTKPQLLFSENGGNNFIKIEDRFDISRFDENLTIKEIEADSNGKIYFVSDNKIFFTQNNQILPMELISPSANNKIGSFTIDPKNPNIIYIGAGNILYKTTDEGANWETLETPAKNFIKEIKINPQNSNTILLSTIG